MKGHAPRATISVDAAISSTIEDAVAAELEREHVRRVNIGDADADAAAGGCGGQLSQYTASNSWRPREDHFKRYDARNDDDGGAQLPAEEELPAPPVALPASTKGPRRPGGPRTKVNLHKIRNKKVREALQDGGWLLTRSTNHYVFKRADGAAVTISKTPSDARAYKKVIADLKRADAP